MRIEPRANLTVTLIRRHQFGSDRLAGTAPRRGGSPAQVHAADRAGVAPSTARPRRVAPEGLKLTCPPCEDTWTPPAWPYDTPLPIGLPTPQATHPAQMPRLQHILPLPKPTQTKSPLNLSDVIRGRLLDVVA